MYIYIIYLYYSTYISKVWQNVLPSLHSPKFLKIFSDKLENELYVEIIYR